MRSSRVSRVIGSALAATAVFAATLLGIPATQSSADILCAPFEPQLTDVTVSQGLNYSPLVRGKTALVKLHLALPSCAGPSDSIELRDATLNVYRTAADGTTRLEQLNASPINSSPDLDPTYPKVAVSGPQVDWPGDPKFVVPGTALAPASTSSEFKIAFEATISFVAIQSGIAVPRTKTFASGKLTGHRVAPKSNALRVLVVPMGDSADANPWVNEFPRSSAEPAVLHALQAASRQLPVADGIARITEPSTAGLRYEYAQGMLDLRPVMTRVNGDNRFCGSGENFSHVKESLAYFLQSWNSGKQGDQQADRVVGVVWHGIAGGYASCAEGWASLISPEAWVRIVPPAATADSPEETSVSGATLAMELGHTFSLVVGTRGTASGHTKSTEADGGSQRAYNLSTRRYIAKDKPTMLFDLPNPWHSHNTLFEQADWDAIQCALTPGWSDSADCATPGVVGTTAGAATAFVIAGVTNVTAESDPAEDRTSAHSYFDSGLLSTPDHSSEYKLSFVKASGGSAKTEGVPVRFFESGHVGSDHDDHGHDASDGLFEFTTTVPDSTPNDPIVRVELTHPSRSAPLYSRQINEAPEVVDSGVQEGVATNMSDPGVGQAPAISRDGAWLAYDDGLDTLHVRSIDGNAGTNFLGTRPTWSQDGDQIAYIRGGNVYVRSFDTQSGTAGGEQLAYDVLDQQVLRTLLPSVDAQRLSWSTPRTGGDFLAVQIGTSVSDIFVLDTEAMLRPDPIVCQYLSLPGDPCYPITRDGASSAPAWSSDDRIAFVRAGQIHLHDVAANLTTLTLLTGTDPGWTDSRLLFVREGQVHSVDGTTLDDEQQLTNGVDAKPSATSDNRLLAVERLQADATTDAVLIDRSDADLTFVVHDEDPSALRLDLFVNCDGVRYPAVVAEAPISTNEVTGESVFAVDFDYGAACPGGVIDARFTDGYHIAWDYDVAIVPDDPNGPQEDPYPIGAIYSPTSGGAALQFDSIALSGVVTDENGTVPDADIRWRLVGPDGTTEYTATGSNPADASPPAGGWAPGAHTAILEVRRDGNFVTAANATFTIVKDTDRDGPPRKCGDVEGEWRDAFGDFDRDGFNNLEDDDPCVSANNAVVSFDPQKLYVPSSGNDVILRVKSTSVDLSKVDPATVRITRVGSHYVDHIPVKSWSYDNQAKAWQAKVDRFILTTFMKDNGLVGFYVPVLIVGRTPSGAAFRGIDPNYPVTSKS